VFAVLTKKRCVWLIFFGVDIYAGRGLVDL
jgi:hypothetical protein